MGPILAVVAALVAGGGAALVARLRPGWWSRLAGGAAVWLGLAVGLLALILTGTATNLTIILIGSALVAGAVGAALELVGASWWWRGLAAALVLAATMAVEYLRGDLFAVNAAIAVAVGVTVLLGVGFATRAAQLADAARIPPLVGLLGGGYLLIIAWGLPNPGLAVTVLVVAAAVLPQLVWTPPVADVALGPLLAAVAWATGVYAWLANASPAMVLAPVLVVGVDVAWTLARRLVTGDTSWRGWGRPGDDLVSQRAAAAGSVRAAAGWLLGATLVVLGLSLVEWLLGVRWLLGFAVLLVPAVGWLTLMLVAPGTPRRRLIAWLVGLTAGAGLLAAAAHLTDGRRQVTLLPLLGVLIVWLAALPRLLDRRRPAATASEPPAAAARKQVSLPAPPGES